MGLIIGTMAGFADDVVDALFDVINAVANTASKIGHGAKDFFTGHFSRLSHEGDYATHVHLTVPPVLSQLARLKSHIKHGGKSSIGRALAEMIQLMTSRNTCHTLGYFRTISLSRWIVNGLVDAVVPGLCVNETS